MNPDTDRIIEDARKRGVDMSWLKAPVQATGGVERLSPGASQLMDAVRQAQAQSPTYMPFPAGTPTQQRRQEYEGARQFDVGHEFQREQFDWERDFRERGFEADQAYRAQQLAAQQAAALGTGEEGLPPIRIPEHLQTQAERDTWLRTQGQNRITNLVEGIVKEGRTWEDIRDTLISPTSRADLSRYLLTDEDVLDHAFNVYEKTVKEMPRRRPVMVGHSPMETIQTITDRVDRQAMLTRDLERARQELGRMTPQQEAQIADELGLTTEQFRIIQQLDPDGLAKLYLERFR